MKEMNKKVIDKLETAFSFSGRRKRADHILLYIVYIIAFSIWSMVSLPLMGESLLLFWVGLILILNLAINNHVKRLHDLGHSGWWVLLFIVPLINLLLLLYLFFFRGQMGGNQYGPDPITGSQERILVGSEKPTKASQVPEEDFLKDDPSDALKKFKAAKTRD